MGGRTFRDYECTTIHLSKAERMKKSRSTYICQSCGYHSPRWMGKCPECGDWNSFLEELVELGLKKRSEPAKPMRSAVAMTEIEDVAETRLWSGIDEFDRVMGGGIVLGSIVLLGGNPGVGKSTILLQICAALAKSRDKILYISGEESLQQIKMRSVRLGSDFPGLLLFSETDIDSVSSVIRDEKPALAIVDSIQTVYSRDLESLPGNVSQVRYCGHLLASLAKEEQLPIVLVGHVTKAGNIAGPRVLEHLVDALFLLEGDEHYTYRVLRAVKNRFGSTNEVGIFEMTDRGLIEVKNPSEYLLAQRSDGTSGSVVTVSMEGSRSLMVEVQALVSPTSYGVPQRTATGIDHRRLAMLLAVLEKRAGYRFGTQDVFVNAAGGLRLVEPGVDLGIAVAIVSSLTDKPIGGDVAVIGEVGLGGEIRGISHLAKRIAEAGRLGFNRVVFPKKGLKQLESNGTIQYVGVESVPEAIRAVIG